MVGIFITSLHIMFCRVTNHLNIIKCSSTITARFIHIFVCEFLMFVKLQCFDTVITVYFAATARAQVLRVL